MELLVKSVSFYCLNIETIYEFGIKETQIFINCRDSSFTQDWVLKYGQWVLLEFMDTDTILLWLKMCIAFKETPI